MATRRTPRSPPRSTSSATCTSSTARSSTGSSPTATRPRRCATRRSRSPRWRARAGRPSCPGSAAIIQEKVLALADDGVIPADGQAAGQVPGRPDRDDPAARARPQARAAAVRGAVDRLAAGAEAAAEAQQIRALKGFGPKAEESDPRGRAAPAEAADGDGGSGADGARTARWRSASSWSPRCARTRPPSASSSPARPGG